MTLFFEDLSVGDVYEVGGRTVTRAEIVEFAAAYDPQPFHIDAEAAGESMFGELIASGLHTLCLSTRMTFDGFISDIANMGGRGYDDLRWHQPVYPGDTLSVRIEIAGKTPSDEYPSGDVRLDRATVNHDGEEVMTFESIQIVERRD